jgi:hypothetical protein
MQEPVKLSTIVTCYIVDSLCIDHAGALYSSRKTGTTSNRSNSPTVRIRVGLLHLFRERGQVGGSASRRPVPFSHPLITGVSQV